MGEEEEERGQYDGRKAGELVTSVSCMQCMEGWQGRATGGLEGRRAADGVMRHAEIEMPSFVRQVCRSAPLQIG